MASSLFVSWGLLFSAFIALLCSIIYAIRHGRRMGERVFLIEEKLSGIVNQEDSAVEIVEDEEPETIYEESELSSEVN